MRERNSILIISLLMLLITLTGLAAASVSEETNLDGDQSSATVTLQPEEGSKSTPILIIGKSDMSVSSRTIDFYSKTYSFPSISLPTVQATSELYYKPTSSGSESFKIAAHKTGAYVSSIKASGFYVATQSGYYRIVGHHRIVSPPGYTPSEAEMVTYTDWKYVSV